MLWAKAQIGPTPRETGPLPAPSSHGTRVARARSSRGPRSPRAVLASLARRPHFGLAVPAHRPRVGLAAPRCPHVARGQPSRRPHVARGQPSRCLRVSAWAPPPHPALRHTLSARRSRAAVAPSSRRSRAALALAPRQRLNEIERGPRELSRGPRSPDRISSVVDIACRRRSERVSHHEHCHWPQPASACSFFARWNCSCGLASEGLPLPPTECQVEGRNWNRPKWVPFEAFGSKFDSHSTIEYHLDPGPPSMALISAVLMVPPLEPESPPELESPESEPESPESELPESPESEPPVSAGASFSLVPLRTTLVSGSERTFSSFFSFFTSSPLMVLTL